MDMHTTWIFKVQTLFISVEYRKRKYTIIFKMLVVSDKDLFIYLTITPIFCGSREMWNKFNYKIWNNFNDVGINNKRLELSAMKPR